MLPSRLLVAALLLYLSDGAVGGVMDNFNDGLKLAGQMFGINTAADVANLVAKAFSGAGTRRQPDILSVLQQGWQTHNQPQSKPHNEDGDQHSQASGEPEQTQETPPHEQTDERESERNSEPTAALGEFNTGQMLSNMLRMVGFDARKLGALAINALVMIAQAIGNSLMQVTRGGGAGGLFGNSPPTDSSSGPDALHEPSEHQPREIRSGTPIDWFLQRPGKQTQRMLRRIMDKQLPEHIVDMIEQRESADQGDAACLKLLMCKSSPIIWGMQKSLQRRLSKQQPEDQEQHRNAYLNSGAFFEHLPSLNEFRDHGAECETRFANHCPRNQTQA